MARIIICKKCGEEKEYYVKGLCQQCYNKRYRTENKEYYREYYKKNQEEILDRQREHDWECKYGVNKAQYDEMLTNQGGKCAICGKTPEQNGKHLAIDHNHTTGNLRGLLCSNCNLAISNLQDSIQNCIAASEYLTRWEEYRGG